MGLFDKINNVEIAPEKQLEELKVEQVVMANMYPIFVSDEADMIPVGVRWGIVGIYHSGFLLQPDCEPEHIPDNLKHHTALKFSTEMINTAFKGV